MPLVGRRRLAHNCTMLPQKQSRLERVHESNTDIPYSIFSSLDLFALKDVFVILWVVCVCVFIRFDVILPPLLVNAWEDVKLSSA